MKKLMMAAILAGSVFAMTADCVAEEAQPAADATAQQACKKAKKAKLTPEERKAKALAKRTAAALEVLKKYGLDEEKAKACLEELKAVLMKKPIAKKTPVAE